VPFTSEEQYIQRTFNRLTKGSQWLFEMTARCVHETLREHGSPVAVFWNAFPWHPYNSGEPHSNRSPTPREVLDGTWYMTALREQFPKAKWVGVGRTAERLLEDLAILCFAVRHPSFGGAAQFKADMARVLRD
jgi:hypothetical protein